MKANYSAKNCQPALNTSEAAARWIRVLTADLASRVNEDQDHRFPRTITIHHRHGGTTKSRQAPLPVTKEMGKEFLYTHALSLWRGIEAEGRAFPANNISIAISGFGDVEDRVQGIQGFLIPGVQSTHPWKGEAAKQTNNEVQGKRKRDDEGIARFLMKKGELPSQTLLQHRDEQMMGEVARDEQMDMGETYKCSQCHKNIPLQDMEEHEDYHLALELSKGSPVRGPQPAQLNTKPISKEEKKGSRRKSKPVEKGQRRLEFGTESRTLAKSV